jgi:predicted DNA-binding transcriptional regulator AlpA
MTKRAFNEHEAAEYTALSLSTLRQGRMDGPRENRLTCPPHVKIGRKVVYLKDDLDGWLEQHRVVHLAPREIN